MSVRLKVPTQLRELTGGAPELDVEASSIKELLEKVGGDHPELLERVLDDDGEIRRFVNLYVGEEDVVLGGELGALLDVDDPERHRVGGRRRLKPGQHLLALQAVGTAEGHQHGGSLRRAGAPIAGLEPLGGPGPG